MDIRITSLPTFSSLTQAKGKARAQKAAHPLVIPQKESNKPLFNKSQVSIEHSSNIIQPKAEFEKKEILLYQQIERNNLFSNNSELLNRFHIIV